MNDTSRPHTAVLNVMIEVHSLTDAGECSGKVVNAQTLLEHGLKPAFLLKVDGNNLEQCLVNLKNKLVEFNHE